MGDNTYFKLIHYSVCLNPQKIVKTVTRGKKKSTEIPPRLLIWFWLCALMIVTFPTVLLDPSLHLNFGIQFIDVLSEALPELGPLGLQGGRQQAVLDREHLRM